MMGFIDGFPCSKKKKANRPLGNFGTHHSRGPHSPFLEDRSGVAKHSELETNKHTVKQLVDLENIEILIEKLGNFHCENLGQ